MSLDFTNKTRLTFVVLQVAMSIGLFTLGVTLLILGAISLVKSSAIYSSASPLEYTVDQFQKGSILLIFSGLIQVLFALFAIIGSALSLHSTLKVYASIILAIHCIALFTSGGLSIAGGLLSLGKYDELKSVTQYQISNLLQISPGLMLLATSGENNQVVSGFLNHLQSLYKCCGLHGIGDYSTNSNMNLSQYFSNILTKSDQIPGSCCGEASYDTCSITDRNVYNLGCFDVLENSFQSCSLLTTGSSRDNCIETNSFNLAAYFYANSLFGLIQAMTCLLFSLFTLIQVIFLNLFKESDKVQILHDNPPPDYGETRTEYT